MYFNFFNLLLILRRIQRLKTQGPSIHAKTKYNGIITFKGTSNIGFGLPTEDARNDDPRTCTQRTQ